MRFESNFAFCVLVVLTGSSQTGGQSSASPPLLSLAGGSSASPDPIEDPHAVSQRTHTWDGTSTETTKTKWTVHSETATNAGYETQSAVAPSQHMNAPVITTAPSPSATADSLSSAPTAQSTAPLQRISTADGRAALTTDPFSTFSSLPAHTAPDTSSSAYASTIQPESPTVATTQLATTGHPLTSATGRGPAGPAHQEVPSELNVGDEDLKGPRYRSSSPLDPLLAGLLSVFIVTTAVVFVILFLKFRQRTNHPEFHRLQDLPMDDLMEDTPLSRYTY